MPSGNALTEPRARPRWQVRLHEIIFESDTRAGWAFDVALLIAILVSVAAVMLESVAAIRDSHGGVLRAVEWAVTIAFTAEYVLRLLSVDHPRRYARSFLGIVDLLSIAPAYLALVVPAAHSLIIVRVVRLLRIYRILKLARFLGEAELLNTALRASRRKITVFLGAIAIIVVIVGALMYVIEGEANGFTSVPVGMYWAVVTLTTVGYGDIAPRTPLGQFLAALVMILGYGVLAVPTGIVSVELAHAHAVSRQACPTCSAEGHDADATHCKHCGARL